MHDAPRALVRPCATPVLLPERMMTQAEVERYWGQDRAALVTCRDRHSTLRNYYTGRDSRLRE